MVKLSTSSCSVLFCTSEITEQVTQRTKIKEKAVNIFLLKIMFQMVFQGLGTVVVNQCIIKYCYGRPLLQAWLLPNLNTISNNCIRENPL